MSGYGQFCPVAKASEILAERWTPLVLRELLSGSHRFNDLHRGVPRMSRSLLSKRLRQLEDAGVVERRTPGERRSHEYHLTPAGEELRPVIESLGRWGQRWIVSDVGVEDRDPSLLMWDVRRSLVADELPDHRVVVRFDFPDAEGERRRWWLLAGPDGGDVCVTDPGFEVDLYVTVRLRPFIRFWLGQIGWRGVLGSDGFELSGPAWARRGLPRWLGRSPFAGVERPRPATGGGEAGGR